jgi:hypothetical protein
LSLPLSDSFLTFCLDFISVFVFLSFFLSLFLF